MNKHYYTFIGCAQAVEYYFNVHKKSTDQSALDAVSLIQGVREALLELGVSGSDDESLKSALSDHVVSLLEAIEILRNTPEYSELDSSLVELLNHYYNISDEIMGGGGDSSPGDGSQPEDPED